jgi:hypothetical protein
MKGTIHHFGDSYGRTDGITKHFVELMSDDIGFKYICHCDGGLSNEMILNKILGKVSTFKNGDVIFINLSFFTRGSYYDKNESQIMSTNKIYNEGVKNIKMVIDEYITDIVDYQLRNSEDYNRRIFQLFNSLLGELIKQDIKIYYIFIEEPEWDNLLTNGINLKFGNGFEKWLISNGYRNCDECHYTKNTQSTIKDYILFNCLPAADGVFK